MEEEGNREDSGLVFSDIKTNGAIQLKPKGGPFSLKNILNIKFMLNYKCI